MGIFLHDDASALDPWCSASQSSSQQCVEAQLFKGWQNADQEDSTGLLKIQPPKQKLEPAKEAKIVIGGNSSALAPRAPDQKPAPSPFSKPDPVKVQLTTVAPTSETPPSTTAELTAWSQGLISLQLQMTERMQRMDEERAKHHAALAHSTLLEWENMTSSKQDLQALHDKASSQQVDLTDWSRDLEALQHRMESRMQAHNKAHEKIDAMDAHLKEQHIFEVKHTKPSLLEQIASLGKEMCSDEAHRSNPKCARFLSGAVQTATTAPPRPSHLRGASVGSLDEAESKLKNDLRELSEKQHEWEKSFVAKIDDTMREFCSDEVHREQSTCKKFLQDDEEKQAAAEKARKQAWHQKFASKIANVGHDLCSDPRRKDYSICKKMFATEETTPRPLVQDAPVSATVDTVEEITGLDSHGHLHLHWSNVADWQKSKGSLRGTGVSAGVTSDPLVLSEKNATMLRRSGHWGGRVPSVACVTLIPSGAAAKVGIQYFIDNFRLQNYEGSKQLILVYHQNDEQAAELVHKYTDGVYIKSAVARGDEFPSAAAYRFGAWIARDADVIARWDFNAYHHPHRLSLQVRAMAYSQLPACLLKRWTVLDKSGANSTTEEGEHWDNSLVGEAAWMRSNWYPYIAEERAAFEAHASKVVRLDMPSLEVFDDASA